MFSPVNSFEVNKILSTNSEIDKDAPFDVKWLAKHFNFDLSDVEKAKFDDLIGVMFQVHFKPGKESVAQQFYDSLVGKGCHPQHFKFNNSVHLDKHQKEKILSAGLSPFTPSAHQALITQQEVTNPFNLLAIRDLIQPTQRVDIISNATSLEKKSEAPFDLSWLKENYKLDPRTGENSRLLLNNWHWV